MERRSMTKPAAPAALTTKARASMAAGPGRPAALAVSSSDTDTSGAIRPRTPLSVTWVAM
jgi:hypothetical protein